MDFRILGSLDVARNEQSLPLPRGKERCLLALLVIHRGEVISSERLIDELWGETPPASAHKSIHVYVSHLRKALADGILVTQGHGYQLRIDPDQVDAHRFERLADGGRDALAAGRPGEAAELLREALGLWRGAALEDFAYEAFARDEAARLDDERLDALEERVEADLRLGRHGQLVGELEALVAQHPLRERLRAQLMLALYRCGRQADALKEFHRASRRLSDDLGL